MNNDKTVTKEQVEKTMREIADATFYPNTYQAYAEQVIAELFPDPHPPLGYPIEYRVKGDKEWLAGYAVKLGPVYIRGGVGALKWSEIEWRYIRPLKWSEMDEEVVYAYFDTGASNFVSDAFEVGETSEWDGTVIHILTREQWEEENE